LSPGTLIMAQNNSKGICRSTDSLNSAQNMCGPAPSFSGQRILFADSNYLLYHSGSVMASYEGNLFAKAVLDSISTDSFYAADSLLIRYYGKGFNIQTDAFLPLPLSTKTVKYISDTVIEAVFKPSSGKFPRGYYNTYLTNPGASGGSSKLFGIAVYEAIPTSPSTNLAFKNRDSSSISLAWNPGNGSSRAVIIRKNLPVILPDRNTVFPNFSSTPVPLGNDQVVFGSSTFNGNSVNMTGLEPNTTYYVVILEFRSGNAPVNYNLSNYASASFKTANVYYNKASGVLNKLSSWSNKADGSGTQPVNFEDSFTYYLGNYNQTPSFDSSWTVTGNRSYVVLGNGTDGLNYYIHSGVKLTVDSIKIGKNITLTNQGEFSFRRSTFDTGSLVQFISNQPQNISPATYCHVTVIGGEKTLLGNATVAGNFNMVTNINSNTYTLALTSAEINSMTYVSGVVKGKFSRLYTAAITSDPSQELFPLGTNSYYKPLRMSIPNTTNTAITLAAEFVDSAASNAGLPQVDVSPAVVVINKMAKGGFWRVSASSSRVYNLSATGTALAGVLDSSKLRLVKRTTGGTWGLQGTAQPVTGTAAAPVVSRTGLSGTGEYGIGSDSAVNPLPVKLIRFEGTRIDAANQLRWSTAFEVNNKGFYIYRSTDRTNWSEIDFVEGKRTASSYLFNDKTGNGETCYYFLGQSDFNGALDYSHIITITGQAGNMQVPVVFPNPVNGNNLSIRALLSYPAHIRILSPAGIVAHTLTIHTETELENISLEKLSQGFYFLEIKDGEQTLNHTFIKN
ncbi:MAG: T9SS type A sorting domain-containing protein, partial [Bacteroidota bacterium]